MDLEPPYLRIGHLLPDGFDELVHRQQYNCDYHLRTAGEGTGASLRRQPETHREPVGYDLVHRPGADSLRRANSHRNGFINRRATEFVRYCARFVLSVFDDGGDIWVDDIEGTGKVRKS